MAVRHTTIAANGMRFDALSAGPADGELVLLLHGFPQTGSCWRNALTTLDAAGYHAVAPSQRGYSAGARPEGVDAYRVSELCDDVLAMASTLGATRFHVIGHDWGATVAWALAGDHPETVISLTAVSTPHTAALRQALQGTRQRVQMAYIPILRLPRVAESLFEAGGGVIAESLLTATGLTTAHAHRDVAALRKVGPTGALNWYRALGTEPAHAEPVEIPVLHIWSDRDPAFTREATELTAEHCTGDYHLLELEGGSHWIPDQHWDDAADVVLEHLAASPDGA
ncbi:MAG TPA: alpha/beta hydrolase [Candidatus Dormibacteraeota bacterium]